MFPAAAQSITASPIAAECKAHRKCPSQRPFPKATRHVPSAILRYNKNRLPQPRRGIAPLPRRPEDRGKSSGIQQKYRPGIQIPGRPLFSASSIFRISATKKAPPRNTAAFRCGTLVVAELGFEPRQTESESVVLPLHNSASLVTSSIYYIQPHEKSQAFFAENADFFQV